MKQLHTEIEIDAPAKRVWELLTDFASYPQWNPFIRQISGRLAPGERLQARLEPPGGRAMTFKPKVLTVEPNRELRWLGHLLLPGLFDGEHSFTIEPLEGNRVRFIQREAFPLTSVNKGQEKTSDASTPGVRRQNPSALPT